MNDLKPCPFCGGEAFIVYNAVRKSVGGNEVRGTAIGCVNCTIQMFWTDKISVERGISAWNRRQRECTDCRFTFLEKQEDIQEDTNEGK